MFCARHIFSGSVKAGYQILMCGVGGGKTGNKFFVSLPPSSLSLSPMKTTPKEWCEASKAAKEIDSVTFCG